MAPNARGVAAQRRDGHRGLRGCRRDGGIPGRPGGPARRAAARRLAPVPSARRHLVGARAALLRAGHDAGLGLQSGRGRALVRGGHARATRAAPRAGGRSPGRWDPTSTPTWTPAAASASPTRCSAAQALRARRAAAVSRPDRRARRCAIPSPAARRRGSLRGDACARSRGSFRATPRSRRSPPRRCSTCTPTTGGTPDGTPRSRGPARSTDLLARALRARARSSGRATTTGST